MRHLQSLSIAPLLAVAALSCGGTPSQESSVQSSSAIETEDLRIVMTPTQMQNLVSQMQVSLITATIRPPTGAICGSDGTAGPLACLKQYDADCPCGDSQLEVDLPTTGGLIFVPPLATIAGQQAFYATIPPMFETKNIPGGYVNLVISVQSFSLVPGSLSVTLETGSLKVSAGWTGSIFVGVDNSLAPNAIVSFNGTVTANLSPANVPNSDRLVSQVSLGVNSFSSNCVSGATGSVCNSVVNMIVADELTSQTSNLSQQLKSTLDAALASSSVINGIDSALTVLSNMPTWEPPGGSPPWIEMPGSLQFGTLGVEGAEYVWGMVWGAASWTPPVAPTGCVVSETCAGVVSAACASTLSADDTWQLQKLVGSSWTNTSESLTDANATVGQLTSYRICDSNGGGQPPACTPGMTFTPTPATGCGSGGGGGGVEPPKPSPCLGAINGCRFQ